VVFPFFFEMQSQLCVFFLLQFLCFTLSTICWTTVNEQTKKGSVWIANDNGTNPNRILTGINNPGSIQMVGFENPTIWIAEGDGLSTVNLDGTNYQKIKATIHKQTDTPKMVFDYFMDVMYYTVSRDLYVIPSLKPPYSSKFLYTPQGAPLDVPIIGMDLDPQFQQLYYAIPSWAGISSGPAGIALSAHIEDGYAAQNVLIVEGAIIEDICFGFDHQLYMIQSNNTLPMIWSSDAWGDVQNINLNNMGTGAGGIDCAYGVEGITLYFLVDTVANSDFCTVNTLDTSTNEMTMVVCGIDNNGEVPRSIDWA